MNVFYFPIILIMFELIISLSNDMYQPGMIEIKNYLSTSQDMVQYTLTIWYLGSMSLILFMGPLSDAFGRKAILIFGCAAFVVSSYFCAISISIESLLFSRFLQGCAVCTLVASYSAIHEVFEPKKAIQIIATITSVTILGPAIGPMIGAIVIEIYDWQMVFWILSFTGAFCFIAICLFVPETNKDKKPICLKVIFTDVGRLLANKEFMQATITFCMSVSIYYFWVVQSPFLVMEQYGLSKIEFGYVQLMIFGAFITGGLITSKLIADNELNKVVGKGFFIMFIGSILLFSMIKFFDFIEVIVLFMMVISFGCAMTLSPLNRKAVDAIKVPMGLKMSVFAFLMNMTGVISTLIITLLNGKKYFDLTGLILIFSIIANLTFYYTTKKQNIKNILYK